MPPSHSKRAEIIARSIYRRLMDEDYDEFPWDDDNEPSNETVEEALEMGIAADEALSLYFPKGKDFEEAVDQAARQKLQDLVRALDA